MKFWKQLIWIKLIAMKTIIKNLIKFCYKIVFNIEILRCEFIGIPLNGGVLKWIGNVEILKCLILFRFPHPNVVRGKVEQKLKTNQIDRFFFYFARKMRKFSVEISDLYAGERAASELIWFFF